MEPQFEALAQEIADVIAKRIEPQFEELEGRLSAHVDKRLASAVAELKHRANIHKEELKDDVKKAAEDYDATLRTIERELSDLNQKVDNGFRDDSLAITNHSNEIAELEKRR